MKLRKRQILLPVFIVLVLCGAVSFFVCFQVVQAEAYARYLGIKNVSSEKIAKLVHGVEMNAKNIFDDVADSHETPDEVIDALRGKVNLNLDVRGYFAAFEPNYFPEKGTWFEPYVYQPETGGFDYRQVGSARHNYHKSPWYVRAKQTARSFWSDPYYYYDGTSMSGHYCTFVKPIFDEQGKLICVCGADIKFEWLARELQWVDDVSKESRLLNKYHFGSDFHFYTVIFDSDGTCVSHPEGKTVTITDPEVLKDLATQKHGTTLMLIDGSPYLIYYGPVENIDWMVAIVVPETDILQPLIPIAGVMLGLTAIGLFIVWLVCRRIERKIKYEDNN